MEIKVEVLDIHLDDALSPGRYNLHCRAETEEGNFTYSSLLQLQETRQVTQLSTSSLNHQWMKFLYEFHNQYLEAALCLTLSDLSDAENQVELAESFLPLKFKPELMEDGIRGTQTVSKATYLVSKLEHLPVVEQVGRLNMEITVTYSEVGQIEQSGGWTSLDSVQSHLPLFGAEGLLSEAEPNVQQSSSSSSEEEEEIVIHEDSAETFLETNSSTFPKENPVIKIIFHTFATEDVSANYQPVTDISANLMENTPLAVWNLDQTHNRLFQYANILTERNYLVLQNPHLLSLHLMKNSNTKPIFSAFESLSDLCSFSFKHQAWVTDYEKPTLPSDPLLQATKHIVTSLHCTPPTSTYAEFCGLEVAIMRFNIESQRDYVVVIEALPRDQFESYAKPTFLRQESLSLTDCKLAILQSVDDTQSSSVYFFLKSEDILDHQQLDGSPMLILLIYAIDPASTKPWWDNGITCSIARQIDEQLYSLLTDRTNKNGLRWTVDWEHNDWSLEVVLRWKNNDMHFLDQMNDEELYNIPVLVLDPIPHEAVDASVEEPLIISLQEEHSLSMNRDSNDTAVTIQHSLPRNRDSNQTVQDSERLVKENSNHPPVQNDETEPHYLEIIAKLTDQIQRLQEENSHLQQERGYLQGQLDQQQLTSLHTTVDPVTKRELQACTKTELIFKVLTLQQSLEAEMVHKERYQQKVFEAQNELLGTTNKEQEYLKLQEAHMTQQKLVQELQRKVHKYYQCYETSLQQEKVINHLETLMAQKETNTPIKLMPACAVKDTSPTHRHGHGSAKDNSTIRSPASDQIEQREAGPLTSEIEERVNRLEVLTNQTHVNQANLAVMLRESAARESHLRQSLMVTRTTMEKLKAENEALQKKIMVFLKIRPRPLEPKPKKPTLLSTF